MIYLTLSDHSIVDKFFVAIRGLGSIDSSTPLIWIDSMISNGTIWFILAGIIIIIVAIIFAIKKRKNKKENK